MAFIEKTQFSRISYLAALNDGTLSKIAARISDPGFVPVQSEMAMLEFQKMVEDPASELNVKLGGLGNVRTIRVLQDTTKTEEACKLDFALITSVQELEAKKRSIKEEDARKERAGMVAVALHLLMESAAKDKLKKEAAKVQRDASKVQREEHLKKVGKRPYAKEAPKPVKKESKPDKYGREEFKARPNSK